MPSLPTKQTSRALRYSLRCCRQMLLHSLLSLEAAFGADIQSVVLLSKNGKAIGERREDQFDIVFHPLQTTLKASLDCVSPTGQRLTWFFPSFIKPAYLFLLSISCLLDLSLLTMFFCNTINFWPFMGSLAQLVPLSILGLVCLSATTLNAYFVCSPLKMDYSWGLIAKKDMSVWFGSVSLWCMFTDKSISTLIYRCFQIQKCIWIFKYTLTLNFLSMFVYFPTKYVLKSVMHLWVKNWAERSEMCKILCTTSLWLAHLSRNIKCLVDHLVLTLWGRDLPTRLNSKPVFFFLPRTAQLVLWI